MTLSASSLGFPSIQSRVSEGSTEVFFFFFSAPSLSSPSPTPSSPPPSSKNSSFSRSFRESHSSCSASIPPPLAHPFGISFRLLSQSGSLVSFVRFPLEKSSLGNSEIPLPKRESASR